MRQVIDRILEGKFDYEKGSLDFSCPRVEITMGPNELYTGSFGIVAPQGKEASGFIYCSDLRLKLYMDSFSGQGQEVGFSFSSKGLEEGDVIQSEIVVISNQGEYYLPYVVTIAHKEINTSLGDIKNLFHFTNLAKSNWDEALKLFYSDYFEEIFQGNDNKYKKAYKALSTYYGNEQNLEEFLLVINKKSAVEYLVEQTNVTVTATELDTEEHINITRNGWGYTYLNVRTDSDFIILSKDMLNDSDFLGNYLSYPFKIDNEKLHKGNNYGRVTFYNSFTRFSVNITVLSGNVERSDSLKSLDAQRAIADMLTYYQAFRTKRISADTWLAETKRIVDRLQVIDSSNVVTKLYKAQVLITEERYNEAKWLLDQIEKEFADNHDFESAKWAYYLYLTTMYEREDSYIDQITGEVENIYSKDPSEWRVAWMLLYLSEEFAISPSRKWVFLTEQLSRACASPMIYVEAVNMLIASPSLLTKLGSIEQRIMRYAAKNELMTEDLINQFVYLAGREKEYSDNVFFVLKKCYEVKQDAELLTVICEHLIKGDKRGEEYLEWYLKGIECEVRVTNLYEYYMMSLDMNRENEIPKMVLLFFSYQNSLPNDQAAYLYAYIVTHKDEYPEIYNSYIDAMEIFALDGIRNQNIDKNYAVLYRNLVDISKIDSELAVKLSRLIFMNRIKVNNPDIVRVIIIQSKETDEKVYPVMGGTAYVPIYDKDYTIIFEDGLSNRYITSIQYDIEKLVIPGKMAAELIPYVDGDISFDVYVCECSSEMVDITEENRERYRRILESVEIDEAYKAEIRNKLMQYYYENDRIRELDEVLNGLEPDTMAAKERVMCIRFMVLRGMFDKAISWIVDYGLDGVEPKDLVKLCSKLISRSDFVPSSEITCIAMNVFLKGKYDEIILRYLADNYHGMTREMRKIFNAAENFEVDIYNLCENILVQMLYTGYFVAERGEIYKKYIQGGANSSIQLAFLAQCSYEYFVKEQLIEPFIFEEIIKCADRCETIQLVSKLALVKYYSEEKGDIEEHTMELVRKYLSDMLDDGIYMSFFKDFMENGVAKLNNFTDKTFIEYKTKPGRKVYIHYVIEGEESGLGEYNTEPMKEMYGGVHSKPFVLFFGENLMYYITEVDENGTEQLTESNSISKSDISREISESRFNAINDIVIAKTLQDYDTTDNLIYEYFKREYMIKNLFKLQ